MKKAGPTEPVGNGAAWCPKIRYVKLMSQPEATEACADAIMFELLRPEMILQEEERGNKEILLQKLFIGNVYQIGGNIIQSNGKF